MSKRPPAGLALAAILLLALGLRLWGIHWGLPNASHYFPYHTDESIVLGAAIGMNTLHGDFLPHFYRYGSLQLYLINFAATAAFLAGAADLVIKDMPESFGQIARLILVGRLLTVMMGVGTVWATYALAGRIAGKWEDEPAAAGRRAAGGDADRKKWVSNRTAGLLAAALLAVSPLHAQHSHFLTVDVPATLWSTLSLVWALRLATDDPRPLRAAVVAAIFAGLAAATKYNLALIVLPAVVAGVARFRARPAVAAGAAFAVAGIAALAFLAGCPGSLAETKVFLNDVHAEVVHVSQQGGPPFAGTGNGFWYQIAVNLFWGEGPLCLLAAAVYLIRGGWRGAGALTLVFAVPYYVLIAMAEVRYARYAIPLLPIVCAWAGAGLAGCPRRDGAAGEKERRRSALGYLGSAAAVVTVVASLAVALRLVVPMAAPDPRDRALAYLKEHDYTGPYGFATMPWFQSPPVDPYFSAPQRGYWQQSSLLPADAAEQFLYNGKDWDPAVLDARPPVLLLSIFDYRDAVRVRQPDAMDWLARVQAQYRPVAVYGGFARRSLRAAVDRHGVGLPYDMLYTSPETWVLVRSDIAPR